VPHCGAVLESATSRAYNLRYRRAPPARRSAACTRGQLTRAHCRLCVAHLRAETVELDGQAMRFCQKCSRFEPLSVFRVRPACGAHHAARASMR
jgi:hypothetical protein